MTNLAVIPARGGSKRIPRKNIKDFYGSPLISYSIKAAIDSNCFDKIIVSTDDEEIAEIALKYGAEVPFIRNNELSNDFTGTTPVIKDAIDRLNINDLEYVCCIYATAPMLDSIYIQKGLEALERNKGFQYAFSITSYAFPIQRAITLSPDNHVSMITPENLKVRSQDLEECWHDAGQFYWGTKEAWEHDLPIFDNHSIGIKIPRYLVQDIDTLEDWETAEFLYKAWSNS